MRFSSLGFFWFLCVKKRTRSRLKIFEYRKIEKSDFWFWKFLKIEKSDFLFWKFFRIEKSENLIFGSKIKNWKKIWKFPKFLFDFELKKNFRSFFWQIFFVKIFGVKEKKILMLVHFVISFWSFVAFETKTEFILFYRFLCQNFQIFSDLRIIYLVPIRHVMNY